MDLLVETDLTDAERRLCQAAAKGRLLDLRVRRAAEDHPAHGPGWGPERQIRAQVLSQCPRAASAAENSADVYYSVIGSLAL